MQIAAGGGRKLGLESGAFGNRKGRRRRQGRERMDEHRRQAKDLKNYLQLKSDSTFKISMKCSY